MDKKTLSRISAFADAVSLNNIAQKIIGNRELLFLKKPEKTMVLLQVKEPVKQSRFYLGEMLAVHCIVELSGVKGAAVIHGDDFSKVQAAAVIDAAHTGGFEEFKKIENELLALAEVRKNEESKMIKAVKDTQVRFHVLEDQGE